MFRRKWRLPIYNEIGNVGRIYSEENCRLDQRYKKYNTKESDKEADIKYIEKGEIVYLRKRIIGRNFFLFNFLLINKLQPYWNDSN